MGRVFLFFILATSLFIHCKDGFHAEEKLPILGFHNVHGADTTYHSIRPFQLLNRDSSIVDNERLSSYVYVADFFFTHCPTICPKLSAQMLRIQDHFDLSEEVRLVSFTLDPKRDSIPRLNVYADKIGASDQWYFLTGSRDSIWSLCEDYFSVALEEDDAPGGINHSGKLLLVDQKGRVRSFCEGTDPDDVTRFIDDIENLLENG